MATNPISQGIREPGEGSGTQLPLKDPHMPARVNNYRVQPFSNVRKGPNVRAEESY